MSTRATTLALAAIVTLAGCGEEWIPVYVMDARYPAEGYEPDDETLDVLAEAGEVLGFELVPVDYQRGAVIVEFLDVEGPDYVSGRALIPPPCWRSLRTARNAHGLAHEVGHAMGLKHHDDATNLMRYGWHDEPLAADPLTDEQRDELAKGVRRIHRCWNG